MKLLSTEEAQVFRLIRSREEITKLEISEELKIPLTTLNRMMKKLLEDEWIEVGKIAPSSGGRRPEVYVIGSKRYYFFGIDLSRVSLRVVLCNLRMEVIFAKEFTMTKDHTPEKVLELCKHNVDEQLAYLQQQNPDREVQVLGLGIGTVGPLDHEEGRLGKVEGFLSGGWENLDLRKKFEKKIGLETWVDNGANTGCLAEAIYGIGKKEAGLAYFQIGKGIRSAHMTQGILLRTLRNTEDAVAHMCVERNGKECSCGRRGCLEAYVALTAFEGQGVAGVTDKDRDHITAGKLLAMGLGNYIRLFSPDKIILTGPLFQEYPEIYKICLEELRIEGNHRMVFSEGSYKELSMAVGAAAMVLERKVL